MLLTNLGVGSDKAHWVSDRRPATMETPAHAADPFTAKPNLAVLMRLRSMKTLVAPGAISIPWQRNLASEGQDALFRGEADLRALYKRARIGRDTTVIAYCRSGVEASMTYFVLRYLGFDPSLFDGSFIEWSNDDDTPVV